MAPAEFAGPCLQKFRAAADELLRPGDSLLMLSLLNIASLKVELYVRPNLVWIQLTGQASSHQVRDLDRELHRALALQPLRVVLDLADLQSLSNGALRSLVCFRNAVHRQGGAVAMVGASQPILAALENSGATSLFAAG